MSEICDIVREMEENYTSGSVKLSKFVDWSMYDTIQTIDSYLNSTHTSGIYDSLDREKPFYNIVVPAVNIWYRATDIDRKDIRILPTSSSEEVSAFVATILLQEWMRKENFGVFLNTWGRTLAKYGSAVCKFVKKDERLIPSVVSWQRLIVDPIDFSSSPIIEKLYFTPAQLRREKSYNQEIVEKLIEKSQENRKDLENQDKDHNNDNFIEIYEVHGKLPLSYLTDEQKDSSTDRQQMQVVSFVGDKDFILFRGKEEDPYVITHLIAEDGRTLAVGAVEYLKDAQWMVNHSIKQQRDYLDLATKLIFQTSDQRYAGRNALAAIEQGDILVYQPNQPLTQINNTATNISASQAFTNQWIGLSRELTSTPDSMRGNTFPSGTPYALGALLTQNASSLFELMTENKGLDLEEMMRRFVIPHLKTKMDTSDEIAAILDQYNIVKLDSMYVPREAVKRYNQKAIAEIIEDKIPSSYNQMESEMEVRKELLSLGNTRYLKPSEISTKTWKNILKDFEWDVRIQVTNETVDKQSVMQTLATLYTQTAQRDPVKANLILSKILTESGVVSPLEFNATNELSVGRPSMQPQMAV